LLPAVIDTGIFVTRVQGMLRIGGSPIGYLTRLASRMQMTPITPPSIYKYTLVGAVFAVCQPINPLYTFYSVDLTWWWVFCVALIGGGYNSLIFIELRSKSCEKHFLLFNFVDFSNVSVTAKTGRVL